MSLTLKVWRQNGPNDEGRFETYRANEINDRMSFLEMLDVVNEQLLSEDIDPIAFDHDCREGICGSCGVVINGTPHGPNAATTTCQLHMRYFNTGDTITVEPWRARAFPIIKDLVVDRSAFDKIIQSGGFITAPTGGAQEANLTLVPKSVADLAMDAAACIGCGACVAACPNGAAQLFTSAKVSHLNVLPQGQPERWARVTSMVDTMETYFGSCTNFGECEAVCPAGISLDFIAKMNRDYLKAKFKDRRVQIRQVDVSDEA
ncbi:MAG: succinate dehydrogenase/fumarate reductase iron-sulfur subunit [Anaerolineaceae bacterium]